MAFEACTMVREGERTARLIDAKEKSVACMFESCRKVEKGVCVCVCVTKEMVREYFDPSELERAS